MAIVALGLLLCSPFKLSATDVPTYRRKGSRSQGVPVAEARLKFVNSSGVLSVKSFGGNFLVAAGYTAKPPKQFRSSRRLRQRIHRRRPSEILHQPNLDLLFQEISRVGPARVRIPGEIRHARASFTDELPGNYCLSYTQTSLTSLPSAFFPE
jgi:hypothetical protein